MPLSKKGAVIEGRVGGLGERGDGLVETPLGCFYVPGALGGEIALFRPGAKKGAGRMGVLEAVSDASPDRAAPPCPHAAVCGGCDLQHLAPKALAEWKRDKIRRAISRVGLDESVVAQTITIAPGTRRRLDVGLRGRKSQGVVGFFERGTHRLIDTPHCLLPTAALRRLLDALRAHAPGFLAPGEETKAVVSETDAGTDLLLELERAPDLRSREALAALAETADIARLTLQPKHGSQEPVATRRPPIVKFGTIAVAFPPGAFLQPSLEGQFALQTLVLAALDHLRPGQQVGDLFCGLGTFAVPLMERGLTVRAYDVQSASIDALKQAGVKATARDLFRDPLSTGELSDLAAVVVNPARAGAQAQCAELAAGGPPSVVMASCAPGTFARDARTLADGGYVLERVTPVDQFTWSHHVELVAVFRRG